MPVELSVAEIQQAFIEYRANFKEPITIFWFGGRQGEIINAMHKALAPWRVGLENKEDRPVLWGPPFDWEFFILTYCLILGLATEYSTSVRKFTATYVKPIARMQPCTRK